MYFFNSFIKKDFCPGAASWRPIMSGRYFLIALTHPAFLLSQLYFPVSAGNWIRMLNDITLAFSLLASALIPDSAKTVMTAVTNNNILLINQKLLLQALKNMQPRWREYFCVA